MNSKTLILAAVASSLLTAPVWAQDKAPADASKPAVESSESQAASEEGAKAGKRGPIDLEKFSRIDDLKAADKNSDGILSDEELRDLAQQRLLDRETRRLKHRLDVNKDGKISIDAIEKHKKERFEALDTNKDGKIDRDEFRAGHKDGKKHGKHHGKHHHGKKQNGENKPEEASGE